MPASRNLASGTDGDVQLNPYSTCFVRPGQIPYAFAGTESTRDILDRWRVAGWRGQIIGPHGAGKSTLAHTLLQMLAQQSGSAELPAIQITIRTDRQIGRQALPLTLPRATYLVDGIEHLDAFQRHALLATIRRRDAALLLTCHRPLRQLPRLMEIEPCPETLARLVKSLEPEFDWASDDIEQIFHLSGGNLRESLMVCYDHWEQRLRMSNDPPSPAHAEMAQRGT